MRIRGPEFVERPVDEVILYDEDADLWWSGPSDIAELFKEELKRKR